MKFYSSNDQFFACAEQGWQSSTLFCVTSKLAGAKREIPGKITGITHSNGNLLCLVEYCDKRANNKKVILHTFDEKLNEIESEALFEGSPWHHGLVSAMDAHCIYILKFETGLTALEGENQHCFDAVCDLAFTKINVGSKERTGWTLKEVPDIVNGYVSGIDSMYFSGERLLLECVVYDPDSTVEFDDSDFDENELDDAEYIDLHSGPKIIRVRFDEKELSPTSEMMFHDFPKFSCKMPFWKDECTILNVASQKGKVFVAADRGFYCIDTCSPAFTFNSWYFSEKGSEQYRYFHLWNGKLIFENRNEKGLTGFQICPAEFDKPDESKWVDIEF